MKPTCRTLRSTLCLGRAGLRRYGVPAGLHVNVTWVYLSRALEWEKQLPREMRELVTPLGERARQQPLVPLIPPALSGQPPALLLWGLHRGRGGWGWAKTLSPPTAVSRVGASHVPRALVLAGLSAGAPRRLELGPRQQRGARPLRQVSVLCAIFAMIPPHACASRLRIPPAHPGRPGVG